MFKKITRLINKLNKSINITNGLDSLLHCKVRSNSLLNMALSSTESIVSLSASNEPELIVSFTTYNKRIHDVHLVIESIAQQTLKSNRLILWLDEDEFTLETIPLVLHKQIARGLEVRFCPNYKSYKKLIPTLKLFPNANIITIDDDILYPHDMVEMLTIEHKRNPTTIIGHRAHKINVSDNKILPYQFWENETKNHQSSNLCFITTGGGTLFPVNSFNSEVLNVEVFLSLCPNADDVWFKAMALLNNTGCKKVNDDRDFFNRFLLLSNSQDIALYRTNIINNDIQLKAVFDYYDLHKKFFK